MALSCHTVNETTLGIAKCGTHLVTIDDPAIVNIKIDFLVLPVPRRSRARATQPATCLRGSKNGCMGTQTNRVGTFLDRCRTCARGFCVRECGARARSRDTTKGSVLVDTGRREAAPIMLSNFSTD